jgi:hypothetical protein
LVGLHVFWGVGAHPVVVHLNAQHPLVLQLLGTSYALLSA